MAQDGATSPSGALGAGSGTSAGSTGPPLTAAAAQVASACWTCPPPQGPPDAGHPSWTPTSADRAERGTEEDGTETEEDAKEAAGVGAARSDVPVVTAGSGDDAEDPAGAPSVAEVAGVPYPAGAARTEGAFRTTDAACGEGALRTAAAGCAEGAPCTGRAQRGEEVAGPADAPPGEDAGGPEDAAGPEGAPGAGDASRGETAVCPEGAGGADATAEASQDAADAEEAWEFS